MGKERTKKQRTNRNAQKNCALNVVRISIWPADARFAAGVDGHVVTEIYSKLNPFDFRGRLMMTGFLVFKQFSEQMSLLIPGGSFVLWR